MFIDLYNYNNLDLLIVGIVVAATFVLGITVYLSDRNSITNKTFLIFSLITAIWGVVNYVSYNFAEADLVLWLFRFILFFAIFQAFYLYRLFLVFPKDKYVFSKRHKYFLMPSVFFIAFLTLTPFVFESLAGAPVLGEVAIVNKGPGLILFAILAVSLVIKSLY